MALDQETRLSFNVPAKITNRIVAVTSPMGVRVAFAEAAPGETRAFDFHSAIIMSKTDAIAFAEAILRVASS